MNLKPRVSRKASSFTESVIREMTRQATLHGAINLSQGFPDFPAPADIKRAACDAIEADINQYAVTWGAKRFRDAIAAKTKWHLGLDIDPDREIVVTCGSTEAMIATMLAVMNAGDEVIVFEPQSGAAYYVAHVDVPEDALAAAGNLRMQAGMPAEVYIRTDTRTALDYLLAPVTAYLRRGMREPI